MDTIVLSRPLRLREIRKNRLLVSDKHVKKHDVDFLGIQALKKPLRL